MPMFEGLAFLYGFLFATILVIKYFRDRSLNRTAVQLLVFGLASLVAGAFLGVLVSLGSPQGGQVILVIFAVGSGTLLVIGLFLELLGGAPRPAVQQTAAPAVPQAPPPPAAAPKA
jgi:hypothetical protein